MNRCSVRVRVALAAAVVMLLGAVPIPSSAQTGRVLVYGVIHEITLSNLMQMFYGTTGVRADFVRMSAGEVATRVLAERARPRADVILGMSRAIQEDLKTRGILESYFSSTRAEIPPRFRDTEGFWTGTSLTVQGFIVNNERFLREFPGVSVPRTWEDLLDARYRGHIIAPSPVTSGTGFTFVVSQIFRLGEERAWDYLTALNRNIRFYTASGIAPARSVAAGEFLLGITFAHDALLAVAEGHPVALVHPPKVGWDIGSVSLLKNAPNPDGGKRFIDWVLSRRPMEMITRINFEGPVRADVPLPRGAVPTREIDLVDYDLRYAATNRERILREWARRFQN